MANWFRKLFRDDSRSQARGPAFPWQRVERFESRWALGGIGGLADTSSTEQPLDWEPTTTQEVGWEQSTTTTAESVSPGYDPGTDSTGTAGGDDSSSTQPSTVSLLESALTDVTPTSATSPLEGGLMEQPETGGTTPQSRSADSPSTPGNPQDTPADDEGGATVAPTASYSTGDAEGPGAGVNLGEDGGTLSNSSLGGAG
ncbi:MAG: hypothetical protein ACKOFW_00710, partial [Planctomycetaceae bacterium]